MGSKSWDISDNLAQYGWMIVFELFPIDSSCQNENLSTIGWIMLVWSSCKNSKNRESGLRLFDQCLFGPYEILLDGNVPNFRTLSRHIGNRFTGTKVMGATRFCNNYSKMLPFWIPPQSKLESA